MRSLFFVVLMVLETSCAAGTGAATLCFEHLGEQDKPMPAFCVLAPGAAAAQGDDVTVDAKAFRKILNLCNSASAPAHDALAGVYRWTTDGRRAPNLLGPDTMRQIAEAVRSDADRRGLPVPDVIARLQQRLR